MKEELKKLFDSVTKKQDWCSNEEIRTIAGRTGENPEELDDYIDMLAFDEETLLLHWDKFFDWWSTEVDPRDYEAGKQN